MSKARLTKATLAAVATAGLLIPVATASVASAQPPAHSQQLQDTAGGESLVWQGDVVGDLDSAATQVVQLDNGIEAVITVDRPADSISVNASNGENYTFSISELQQHLDSSGSGIRARPGSCDIATGLAGIGHAALWGGALGGGAGLAAGAAVGAFWWGIGQTC